MELPVAGLGTTQAGFPGLPRAQRSPSHHHWQICFNLDRSKLASTSRKPSEAEVGEQCADTVV